MANVISAVGLSCPPPQNLYPSELAGAPLDAPSNLITLNAGDAIYLPAQSTQYAIDLGQILSLEFNDAVTGTWRIGADVASRNSLNYVQSNGSNFRIANRTGCPVSAIVANGGSGFTQATATLTPNLGGSTWQPIIGGSLTLTTVSNPGAGYTVPPLVLIPSPTPAGTNGSVGGIPATAYATLTNGTVSGVTMDHNGAGYQSAPIAVLVPSQFDPNFGSITQATVTFGINAATTGAVTGALVTNFGAPLATVSALTLTAGGGLGTGATITPQVLQTIVSGSVVAGGAGWGTATSPAVVQAVGGGAVSVAATNLSNPAIDFSGFKPSTALLGTTTNAGGTITAVTLIGGGGLFLSMPTAAIASGGTLPTTLASITFTMGSGRGMAMLQNL